jgi:hypothetical protein
MATTTAIAVIGQSHAYSSGIEPQHFLLLTEDSRPAFQLLRSRGDHLHVVATWIPTVENMIEDLVLMAGALTGSQPELADILAPVITKKSSCIELYDIGKEQRAGLYELSRKSPFRSKVVLTVLEDSSLFEQTGRICHYQMNCELCLSTRADATAAHKEILHA